MTQISRLRNAEIANGNLINADDIAAELNQLVTESNTQDTRLTTVESGNTTLSGNKTLSGNTTLSGTATFTSTASFTGAATLSGTINLSGQTNLARAADPGTPNNGDFWYNSTSHLFKGRINGATIQMASLSDLGAYPIGYHASAPPKYVSATTLTLAFIRERDASDVANITKNTSTTVDITTVGLNGIAQSANLTGTISVTATGTSVTGASTTFTSSFRVGDVITTAGSQSRLITAIASDTAMTVAVAWTSTESVVTYKRGGRGASNSTYAAYYYLYAIAQAAGATPGLLLSTRDVSGGDTLVDLPSGYTLSTQLAFALRLDNSASPVIVAFRVAAGWPSRPRIDYLVKIANGNTDTRVLSSGTASTYTALNCSIFLPRIAREGIFAWESNSTGAVCIRESGNTAHEISVQNGSGSSLGQTDITCTVDSTQQLDYKISNNNVSIYVQGFIVTEVP